jgi:hypothetical protein
LDIKHPYGPETDRCIDLDKDGLVRLIRAFRQQICVSLAEIIGIQPSFYYDSTALDDLPRIDALQTHNRGRFLQPPGESRA